MRQINNSGIKKVRFSIGAKLILIISIIFLVSVGLITALVLYPFYRDLRVSAEENNLEINRRSAMEADSFLENIQSVSRTLIRTVSSAGQGTRLAGEAVNFFFNENPHIASLFFINHKNEKQIFINKQFFSSRNTDESLVSLFFNSQSDTLEHAIQGETALLSAEFDAESFCLALFFPWQDGAGGTLFSCESLRDSFSSGLNRSFMVGIDGGILVSPDYDTESSFKNKKNIPVLESAKINFLKVWGIIKQKIKFIMDKIIRYDTAKSSKINQFTASAETSIPGVSVVTYMEYENVFGRIKAAIKYITFFLIIFLFISILFIWIFSKTISIKLGTLSHAVRQIEGGRFDLKLPRAGNDEIGELTYGFGKMCSALQIYSMFSNRKIAENVIRGKIKSGCFPKTATVLFSDIHDFSVKLKILKNKFGRKAYEKIVDWLNNYFARMSDCVERTHGTVDKFFGDSIMAHWGTVYTSGSPGKDACNCIKSALFMRSALYYMKKERITANIDNPAISIGCGISSGIVTASLLGSEKRKEYNIIGGHVNLASRLKTLTKPMGVDILISEDTWQLVGNKFITKEMPYVKIKKREKPLRIFAVINFSGNPKGPRTLTEVREFIGTN